MPVGFRILKRRRAVRAEVAARYRALPVANVSDCMQRMTAGGARLRPMHDGTQMAGPALTVKSRPGDNLLTHKALQLAEPGDVIVVDAGGDLTNAIIGELMVATARHGRLGGIVINGAIRDATTIRRGDFPVFAAGVSHRGPYKDGPGEINVPVAIDGMVVEPGDLVIGDGDGILSVPYDLVGEIHEQAASKHAGERRTLERIASGQVDRSWIDERLAERGCEIEG